MGLGGARRPKPTRASLSRRRSPSFNTLVFAVNSQTPYGRASAYGCIPSGSQKVIWRFWSPGGAAHLAAAYVDAQQTAMVLGNLVTNACQTMPEGGRLTFAGGTEQ